MVSQRLQLLLSLFIGAGLTLAYAPFSYWFITPLLITAFLFLLHKSNASAFKLGLFFGMGWFGAGISWVHVSIEKFGGLPLIGSLGLMTLLCIYLALFPAIAFNTLKKHSPLKQWWWVSAMIWFVVEWLRGWFLTGFPWLSLGYTQTTGPIGNWAPIIGETGIGMLLVACSALLVKYLSNKEMKEAALLLALTPLVSHGLSHINWTQNSGQKIDIAMVQGNIEQELRWVPEQDMPTMQKYLDLTQNYWDADIIIWPEAAVPRLEPLAQEYLNIVNEQAFATNTGLITGIVNYNFESRDAYNSLITLGKSNNNNEEGVYHYFHNNRYSKHHLLPIGEFIPLEDWIRGLAPIFDLPMSSFSRGDYQQTNLEANGVHFAPAICFEIAFPQQIRANLNSDTDFIITVSNDAWFGNSHGPHQHLEIAQMRAMELGIPVLRATNNGITAFINTKGEITLQAPQFEDAAIRTYLQKTEGMTPYRYFGNLPHWIFVLVSLLFLVREKRRAIS